MKKFIAKSKCFWGPQQGAESLYEKGDVIFAHGTEPGLEEFFEAVDEAPAEGAKAAKGKKPKTPDPELNDL